ncbi:hypothetical protein FQZ97_1165610 [compost metagenome]
MLRSFAAHADGAAHGGGIAGVGQQVDQHLGEALGVAFDNVLWLAEVEEVHVDAALVQ